MPDNFCIAFSEIYLFKNLPNKIAIKSQTTIAQILPTINAILQCEYCTPNPIDDKNNRKSLD